MNAVLVLGPGVRFPADAVTESFVILGKRRGGKSNTAVVMAEAMFDHGLPWVAFDPKGDWYGIRSDADGTGPGLPIPVFGGLHGDLPLSHTSGALIADLIFDRNLTCVLDVSRFTDPQLARFSADFARRMYERHQADPTPRHIFAEEADRYLPQSLRKGQDDMAASVEAWSLMIRLGGAFGLGVTLISQRAARLNNDGMTQAETMIAHRTTAPVDIKVIAGWMAHHHVTATITDSLPEIGNGEAWLSSSHWLAEHGQDKLQRVRFRRRRTFDSGATPKVGEVRQPKRLAAVDLEALRGQLTEVVAQAEANDPAVLRRKLADAEAKTGAALRRAAETDQLTADLERLRGELADARAQALTTREPLKVMVPVFADGDLAALEHAAQVIAAAAGTATDLNRNAVAVLDRLAASSAPAQPDRRPAATARSWLASSSKNMDPPGPATTTTGPTGPAGPDGAPVLKAGARHMLDTLVRHYPMRVTRPQLGALARLAHRGGTFGTYLSALRTAGLVEVDGDIITPTRAGFDYVGIEPGRPATADELRDTWRGILKAGQRAMLDTLISAYPDPLTRTELADAVGLAEAGGTFGTYLSVLRRNALIAESRDGIRAADVFFLQGATHG